MIKVRKKEGESDGGRGNTTIGVPPSRVSTASSLQASTRCSFVLWGPGKLQTECGYHGAYIGPTHAEPGRFHRRGRPHAVREPSGLHTRRSMVPLRKLRGITDITQTGLSTAIEMLNDDLFLQRFLCESKLSGKKYYNQNYGGP